MTSHAQRQLPTGSAASEKSAINVWLLSDGKPGHFNQARGVVRALEFHFPVQTEWIDLDLRFVGYRRVLPWLLNRTRRRFACSQLEWFYRLPELPQRPPDLILSAGGDTLYANVWLARCLGCPNVFIGDIRRLDPRHFARVITFLDGKEGPPYLLWPITPVPVLPEEAALQGREFRRQRGFDGERLWAVLIGGNGGGYRYRPEDWRSLLAFLRQTSAEHSIRWLVVTSRRTGAAAEQLLAAEFDSTFIAESSVFSAEAGTHYLSYIGAADTVFCTEDSHMMITEAISTGKPVYSLIPRTARTHWTNQKFLDLYESSGHLRRLLLNEQVTQGSRLTPQPVPMVEPPLRRLGAHLADWWRREFSRE